MFEVDFSVAEVDFDLDEVDSAVPELDFAVTEVGLDGWHWWQTGVLNC